MRKRIIAVLLVVTVLINNIIFASAEEKKQICYVFAYSTALDEDFILQILNYNDKAYIEVSLAASLAGMDYTEENNKFIFTKQHHRVEISQEQAEKYADDFYLPINEIMNALQTTYIYNEENQLVFIHCTSFIENMRAEVFDILNATNDSPDFNLEYLENTWGIGLAAVYNIISNLRVDYLWGGYQREQYATVTANLMLNEKDDVLELASDGEQIINDLLIAGKLDGSLEYRDFLGYPYDDYLQAYDIMNEKIPGFSLENCIQILQNICVSLHASELYANGIKYALIDNPRVNGNLKFGVKEVYNYYDENKSTMSAITTEVGEDIINWGLEKGFELTTDYFGVNTIWVEATELLFRKLGVNEKTEAAEQTLICAEIQEISKNTVLSVLSKEVDEIDDKDIMTMKYGTILYLRACQYAYSLYEFDKDLAGASSFWKESTGEKITALAAFDDKDLILLVENQPLDMAFVTDDFDKILLQSKLNSLLKESITTQPFLTSYGTDIYSYSGAVKGITNAIIVDADEDGKGEIIAVLYDGYEIILKKYYVNSGAIQEEILGSLGGVGYCDNIGIIIFYNPIFSSYCIALNDVCVGAYTGDHSFVSNLYSIHSEGIALQAHWDWSGLVHGWEQLELIQNEMISAGWPYMNNYYLEFYNDQITSDCIQLTGTEVEITEGETPLEYKRYIHFLGVKEMPSTYF